MIGERVEPVERCLACEAGGVATPRVEGVARDVNLELPNSLNSFSVRLGDFWLDQLGQQGQRFLPAEITRLDGDGCRDSFLRDVQLGAAEHLS